MIIVHHWKLLRINAEDDFGEQVRGDQCKVANVCHNVDDVDGAVEASRLPECWHDTVYISVSAENKCAGERGKRAGEALEEGRLLKLSNHLCLVVLIFGRLVAELCLDSLLDSDATIAPLAAIAGLNLHADRDISFGEGA